MLDIFKFEGPMLMNDNLEINSQFIAEWHPRYDEIANDEEEYRNLVNITSREIGQIGTISKETFIRILNWKSPRVKGIVILNQFSDYEKGIYRAHRAEENQKLPILTKLRGIAGPVGSTILHFIYPDSFPIIDVRTTQVLHHAGHISKCTSDQKYYPTFNAAIHKIARDCPGFTLREIDRALFAYHKIFLEPQLKQSDCKRQIRRTSMATIKDKVTSVFKDKVGQKFLREEIIDLVVNEYPGTNRGSVIPSDYCYNLINVSLPFNFHLFESLDEGRYKCLGLGYPYSGAIYWKGEKVGEWEHGKYTLWKDPRN